MVVSIEDTTGRKEVLLGIASRVMAYTGEGLREELRRSRLEYAAPFLPKEKRAALVLERMQLMEDAYNSIVEERKRIEGLTRED